MGRPQLGETDSIVPHSTLGNECHTQDTVGQQQLHTLRHVRVEALPTSSGQKEMKGVRNVDRLSPEGSETCLGSSYPTRSQGRSGSARREIQSQA